jgi:hypothetical protein
LQSGALAVERHPKALGRTLRQKRRIDGPLWYDYMASVGARRRGRDAGSQPSARPAGTRTIPRTATAPNPKIAPYRILCIDGGGLKGITPLAILERLDLAAQDWRRKINMFAVTSIGGLIALALAKGMTPSELLDIYTDELG